MTVCTSNIAAPFYRERSSYSPAVNQLLIIDRHPATLMDQLPEAFTTAGGRIEIASTAAAALETILHDPPKLILLDPQMPDQSGLELHRKIRQIDPCIPVVFVATPSTAGDAIEAMKQGAYDYLFKPVQELHFQRVLLEAMQVSLQKRFEVPAAAAQGSHLDGRLCGRSPMMREVYKSIGLVAAQNVNVLITGESGTGKELAAQAIVEHSARSQGPFLALNCAAIPETLLESELFGHEKGAFSGAERRRVGRFEQCDGGTILLDEIGDMPLTLQAKILRLLQEQTFERIGGNETIRTNVRIIASTHCDLKALSAEKKFRADLYYRLSAFRIHLPPLRERAEDLAILAQHFLNRYSREMGRGTNEISPAAMQRLEAYQWPGNIRELQNVLKQALLRASGRLLLSSHLPDLIDDSTEPASVAPDHDRFPLEDFVRKQLAAGNSDLYATAHREVDRFLLSQVLDQLGGNQRKAAGILGIARQTLRMKLRELSLSVCRVVEHDDENAQDGVESFSAVS